VQYTSPKQTDQTQYRINLLHHQAEHQHIRLCAGDSSALPLRNEKLQPTELDAQEPPLANARTLTSPNNLNTPRSHHDLPARPRHRRPPHPRPRPRHPRQGEPPHPPNPHLLTPPQSSRNSSRQEKSARRCASETSPTSPPTNTYAQSHQT
jgi:hypothetical protein